VVPKGEPLSNLLAVTSRKNSSKVNSRRCNAPSVGTPRCCMQQWDWFTLAVWHLQQVA
jgi:hypothetical protein